MALQRICKNTPQQGIYDIALVHLNKDITATTSLKPVQPSKQAQLPEKGFIGRFVGYGDQGSGSQPIKTGLATLFKGDPTKDSTRLLAATDDRLGGQNFLNVLNYTATKSSPAGQMLYADLDDGNKRTNIDRQPDTKLKFEYSPYMGDSGAGVFDPSNNLVAIVNGVGYGNAVVPGPPYLYISFAPPKYGSLSFFTPLAQHRGWIAAVINANMYKTFTGKAYVPTNTKYSPVILPTGNLAGSSKSSLPDSMIKIFADVIVEPYPEGFNEVIWEKIFPSKPVS